MENSTEKTQTEPKSMQEQIIDILKTCYDPEIPVDIYELGLIYKIEVDEQSNANVDMTLTSPACPVAGSLPPEVEAKIQNIPGINKVRVNVVWEPPWNPDMMSKPAKLKLNMM